MLRAAYAGSQYKVACGSPLFLRIGGERIDGSDVACYVVRRFQTVVLVLYASIEDVPVAEVKDTFYLRQHLLLYALLDTLAGVVGDAVAVFEVVGDVFQLIVVEVTVATVREVGGEVVAPVQLVPASGGKSIVAVVEVVGQVLPRAVRTHHPTFVVRSFGGEVQFSVYLPFQILGKSIVAGTVYGKHGGTGLQLVLIPLHIRIAPAVGVPEVDTGHRFQFAVVEAEAGALPYIAMLAHTGGAGEFHFLSAPFGNDIDDSGNGIAAVK